MAGEKRCVIDPLAFFRELFAALRRRPGKARPSLLFLACAAALALSGCDGSGRANVTLITHGEHILQPGEVLPGEAFVLDGSLVVPAGARVAGSVYLLGGSVEIEGEVEGEVAQIGGALALGPAALVGGDLSLGGGQVHRSPGAEVDGEEVASTGVRLPSRLPNSQRLTPAQAAADLLGALVVSLLAYLAVQLAPRASARLEEALTRYPLVSAAMGGVAGVVAPSLLVLMAFTLLLIPVSLLGLFILGAGVAWSWAAYGKTLGGWLCRRFNWALHPPAQAAVGALVFVLLLDLLGRLPVIGGILPLFFAASGLGGLLLTRFGAHRFIPAQE